MDTRLELVLLEGLVANGNSCGVPRTAKFEVVGGPHDSHTLEVNTCFTLCSAFIAQLFCSCGEQFFNSASGCPSCQQEESGNTDLKALLEIAPAAAERFPVHVPYFPPDGFEH